ncbi:DUF3080 family protein [Neptunomonas sp. XY-337]|uniref:DUF3080 family protein n=1 Tax=Neptunomonas sp. XY-337 TaxID=2561897 RepID=UPI0010AB33EF|nr:DUF3080 family protein [Neptunomonas sp. XY-337]
MLGAKPLIAIICGLTLLAGCSDTSSELGQMQSYANRVADILDQPTPTITPDKLPAIPAHRQRVFEVPPLREGMLDVLEFRHCGMLDLIAQRNSSLGKVAQASQVLSHEIKFLTALERCLQQPEQLAKLDEETQQHFRNIAATKAAQLPAVLWNGFYTGREVEQNLALSAPLLSPTQIGQHTPVLAAWETFATITEQTRTQITGFDLNQLEGLEEQFATIYNSTTGASTLKSLQTLTATLNAVATTIEARLARRPLCFNGQPTNKARTLRSAFDALYAKELQPYMAYTHRLGQRWFAAHARILKHLNVPADSQTYTDQVFAQTSDKSIWIDYQAALTRHTKAWQSILGQCGLMPGTN